MFLKFLGQVLHQNIYEFVKSLFKNFNHNIKLSFRAMVKQAWKSFSNYDLAISIFRLIYSSQSESIPVNPSRSESTWASLLSQF